jgi:hypothetical protein
MKERALSGRGRAGEERERGHRRGHRERHHARPRRDDVRQRGRRRRQARRSGNLVIEFRARQQLELDRLLRVGDDDHVVAANALARNFARDVGEVFGDRIEATACGRSNWREAIEQQLRKFRSWKALRKFRNAASASSLRPFAPHRHCRISSGGGVERDADRSICLLRHWMLARTGTNFEIRDRRIKPHGCASDDVQYHLNSVEQIIEVRPIGRHLKRQVR